LLNGKNQDNIFNGPLEKDKLDFIFVNCEEYYFDSSDFKPIDPP